MKEYTEKELALKAEAYCVAAERCPSDVEEKLKRWGADEDMAARIVEHLCKERFLDGTRYCRFFVRDKYRFDQWGRMKIVQALRMKRLSSGEIESGLAEIDAEEYRNILRNLLEKKAKTVKAVSDYDRNQKLIRFAVGRGFTMDEIMQQIKQRVSDEYLD